MEVVVGLSIMARELQFLIAYLVLDLHYMSRSRDRINLESINNTSTHGKTFCVKKYLEKTELRTIANWKVNVFLLHMKQNYINYSKI